MLRIAHLGRPNFALRALHPKGTSFGAPGLIGEPTLGIRIVLTGPNQMTPDTVLDIGQSALEATTVLGAAILIPALLVGLVVAMFQAATQINEMTLTFIPKLIIVVVVLMAAGPWMLRVIMNFTITLFESIPELIG